MEAEIAGEEIILGGDFIPEVGGIKLSGEGGPGRIREHIRKVAVGEELKVTVLRDGRRVELPASTFGD